MRDIELSPHYATMPADRRVWHKIQLAREALKLSQERYSELHAVAGFSPDRGFLTGEETKAALLATLIALCEAAGINANVLR